MDTRARIRLAALGAVATLALAAAPVAADPNKSVQIEHNGREISVSCNALDGHLRHADAAERLSLLAAQEACLKIEQPGG